MREKKLKVKNVTRLLKKSLDFEFIHTLCIIIYIGHQHKWEKNCSPLCQPISIELFGLILLFVTRTVSHIIGVVRMSVTVRL